MPRAPRTPAASAAAAATNADANDVDDEDDGVSTVGTPVQEDAASEAPEQAGDDEDAYTEESDASLVAAKAVEKPIINTRVPDRERITTNDMGIFTATALIAIRTKQIGQHGNALIDTAPYSTNEEVATAELLAGRCPIMVKRNVGQRDRGEFVERYWEYFRASEMVLPKAFMHMSNSLVPGKKQVG